jgi:hypothetical protein
MNNKIFFSIQIFDYMMIFSDNKKEFEFEIHVQNMEKRLFFNPGFPSQQSDSE